MHPFTALSAVCPLCPLCPVYSVSTLPPTFPLFASSHHPASQTYVTDHCNPVSSNTLGVHWRSLHTPGEYKCYVVSNPSWGDLAMYYTWKVLTAHVSKTDLRASITGEILWQHAFILFWQPTLGTWYKKGVKIDVSDYLYLCYIHWYVDILGNKEIKALQLMVATYTQNPKWVKSSEFDFIIFSLKKSAWK